MMWGKTLWLDACFLTTGRYDTHVISMQCVPLCASFLHLKVCEETKQQIWVAGLAQRIFEIFQSFPISTSGHAYVCLDMFRASVRNLKHRQWRPWVHWCRVPWLGGQRATFAGEHSLGNLFDVERQWQLAFRWSF